MNFGRDGSSAMRFTTLEDDSCVHSGSNPCPNDHSVWERSELTFTPPVTNAPQGSELWWAHSVFLPVGVPGVPDFQFPTDNWNAGFFLQFHSFAGHLFGLGWFNQPGPNPHRVFRAFQIGVKATARSRR